MFNAIKRLLGVHVHDWNTWAVSEVQQHERHVELYEEQVVGYDETFEEDIIENVPTGEFVIEPYTITFQSRKCSSCGKEERRRV